MERWQRILKKSVTSAEELAEKFDVPLREMKAVEEKFGIRITPYYLSLIKKKGDPIYKQVVPDIRELDENNTLLADPLGEENDSPVNNIVHRYPDRCLFLISPVCASYCRFCTRNRKVGDPEKINMAFIDEGVEYIRRHKEIRDVILSGGDPLMLKDEVIESVLKKVRGIEHVEIIRIGSRMPCFLPHRITNKLVNMLRKYHPLYMNVHFNHPDELTPLAMKALGKLANAGIPLGNQTVLLKGVNDDPVTMKKLMQKLLQARVRPYYIYQADMVLHTEHFRTKVEDSLEIIKNLRGWTSGLAVPHFVIDAPGGGGKIPLLPEYLTELGKKEVTLKNYRGKVYKYAQPHEEGNFESNPPPSLEKPLIEDVLNRYRKECECSRAEKELELVEN